MASMYDRLRAMTTRRLKPVSEGGQGAAGVLQRTTSVYNPDTDMNEQTITAHDISGIRASYKIRHIDGTLIRQGDVKFYLCPVKLDNTNTPAPETTDKLLFDGKTYFIVTVKTWKHADVDCGWILQLRTA
jgi:hypothetical protein